MSTVSSLNATVWITSSKRLLKMQNKLSLARYVDWLTSAQHNLKSFSILRIMYGFALLFLLVPSIPERSLVWGEASFWTDPEASRRGYWTFDTLLPTDSALLF